MALDIFISYAHEDEQYRNELIAHLANLRSQGIIQNWYDGDIAPGTEWEAQILTHLAAAQIILLLISSDFMNSDFCNSVELKQAITRHDADQARVIPIILRPTDWEGSSFAKLQALPTYAKPISKWEDHDEAFTDVIRGIRRAIEDLNRSSSSKPSASLPTETSTASAGSEQVQVENIPFRQNPYFTGRSDVLDRLRTSFLRGGKEPYPQVISGLGGIGKTQTALEYAYRYGKDYRYIFWVKADTQDLLSSDFASLAKILNLSLKDEKDQTLTIQAVKQWLKTHTGWLLILDNADKLDNVLSFLPTGLQGHVLLTSRTRATGVEIRGTELEQLSIEDGLLFLLRRSGVIELESSSLETVSREIQDTAKQIVKEMDGLPLALAQVGGYIERTRCGFAGYLERYQRRRGRLLNEPAGLTAEHPEPVATTWSLSFEEIEKSPAAADLLRICAFLHPDAIPEDLIINGASELSPALQSIADDLLDFDDTITELFKYSLIRRNLDLDTKTLTIHRLVQTILRDALDEDAQKQWAERTVRAVNRTFPDVQFSTWQVCEQLLPHVQVCAIWITQWNMAFSEAAQLLHKAGKYLSERGQYTEAEQLLTQALAIYKQAVGTEHPDTASNLNDLAELYRLQGKYIQAEQFCQQALAIRKQVLEPTDPDIATSLHTLARAYHRQGRYAEAEPLYKQALEIRKRVLGAEHPDTTMSFHDLALLYQDRGKYREAESLYKQALEIRKRILGMEHPDTATSLHGLASLYQAQGKYGEAESLYKQALEIRERVLGAEHPDTATNLGHLADLYETQGKYGEAESLCKQALAIRERVLGAEHPNTASSLNSLAELYKFQGKYGEAESLCKQALAIRERVLGAEHPDTGASLNNLAILYKFQGRYEEAEPLYKQGLAICEQVLGTEHPDTATSFDNLAGLYQAQGRLVLAKHYHKQALSIRERVLGSKHPQTATSLANLAMLYTQENNYRQAETLFLRALTIYERVLGPEHPGTINVLQNYLTMLLQAKRRGRAAEIQRRIEAAQAKESKE